jgi:hypothetical protein
MPEPQEGRSHATAFLRAAAPQMLRSRFALSSSSLPPEMIALATVRLQGMALLYAFLFFAANIFPRILHGDVMRFFSELERSLPGVLSIAMSLGFWAWLRWGGASKRRQLDLGLVYLPLACYGITFAEFWTLYEDFPILDAVTMPHFGLSFVITFVLPFAVVVPNTPGRVLASSLAAGSSVSVVIWLSHEYFSPESPFVEGAAVFLGLVFPYILVALIATYSARIVFNLGRAVRRAQDLGSYRLEKRIGEGGMGEVWLARHRMLARPAAVKLIRVEALRGGAESVIEARARFKLEARATAALRSPHTVEIYDFGVADDGALYYVMEYLEGLDLQTLVSRFGPQSAERVIYLIRQVCASLEDAREIGLLHRDIKPANLFAAQLGTSYDFVKVVDFGLVKSRDTEEEVGLTREGVAPGTPAYMAPEVILGDEADHRGDLYALGCVAYYLLTGTSVFEDSSPMKVMMDHVRKPPGRPSAKSEVAIPAALDDIVLSCLAKDPSDRPQSAAELSDALARIDVEHPWDQAQARRWWSRHAPRRTDLGLDPPDSRVG